MACNVRCSGGVLAQRPPNSRRGFGWDSAAAGRETVPGCDPFGKEESSAMASSCSPCLAMLTTTCLTAVQQFGIAVPINRWIVAAMQTWLVLQVGGGRVSGRRSATGDDASKEGFWKSIFSLFLTLSTADSILTSCSSSVSWSSLLKQHDFHLQNPRFFRLFSGWVGVCFHSSCESVNPENCGPLSFSRSCISLD